MEELEVVDEPLEPELVEPVLDVPGLGGVVRPELLVPAVVDAAVLDVVSSRVMELVPSLVSFGSVSELDSTASENAP